MVKFVLSNLYKIYIRINNLEIKTVLLETLLFKDRKKAV